MIKQKLRLGGASLALILAAPGAQALQFDGAHVTSRLSEPLDARFTIRHLAPAQAGTLEVSKAPPSYYERFGFKRDLMVGRIELKVEATADGPAVVHLSTDKPITASMISFLVEASTENGHYFHRYDLLINPPQRQIVSSRSDDASRYAGVHGDTHLDKRNSGKNPAVSRRGHIDVSRNEQYPDPGEPRKHENYGPVEDSQTLWRIAGQLKPEGATTAQMAVAMYRATPRAFEGGIDGLEEGAFLTVPYDVNVLAVDPGPAERMMREADFQDL